MDEAKLHQFVGQMLSDLGGAASVALVRMGDQLGLYKTLHQKGPMTVPELAAAARVNERYLREWASHQAASNYLSYDPASGKFALPEEQAMVFAVDDSPVNMTGAFDLMVALTGCAGQGSGARSRPAAACRGMTTSDACSAPSRSSFGRDTTTTWCPTGCQRSTASSKSWSGARRWPISGAAMAGPPS